MKQQSKDMKEIKEMLREIIDLLKTERINQRFLENIFSKNPIDDNVTNYLYYLGFKTQYTGFGMLRQAIILLLQYPTQYKYLNNVYAKIAEDKQTKINEVERCIRYAIEITYQKSTESRKEIWEKMFGSSIIEKGKVTNSEFISRAVEEIGSCMSRD